MNFSENTLPVFFSICFLPYDTADRFHGPFAHMLRRFYTEGGHIRTSGQEFSAGVACRYHGSIHGEKIKWTLRWGHRTLEECLPTEQGTALLLHDRAGNLTGRALFSGNRWVRSAYFEPGEYRAQVILEPFGGKNCLARLDYLPETGQYLRTLLYPAPYFPGTPRQSYLNSQAGEPVLLASTSMGDLCYCPLEEQQLRLEIWEELLKLPEFRDADKAHQLMSFLSDSKENLPVPDEGPMKILIGPENVSEALQDTSVVVASYDIGDDMRGLIGVVGPTRMDYGAVAARLSGFAEGLTRLFGKQELPPKEDTDK